MRKITSILITLIFIVLAQNVSANLWERQGPPLYNIRLYTIFFLDNGQDGWVTGYDYSTSDDVFFRTSDGGANWTDQQVDIRYKTK